ncbi:unnamed protein product [Gongylonema pulchrum]|uniref:Anaphase-promoting complex subunit 5 n=1 Tax=Gongylonema pulchrum TaxID=637853 RepID=A0A183E504_9BILA|nr:unnamed protein product [Gongylonema pulchrum]
MALTQNRQSLTEIQRTHQQWLEWLKDARVAARDDLFGTYAFHGLQRTSFKSEDEIALLAPLIQNISNLTVSKDTDTRTTSGTAVAQTSAPRTEDPELARKRSLFKIGLPVAPVQEQSSDSTKKLDLQTADILSSSRARMLITREMLALHVAPDEAMDPVQLEIACECIRKRYPDLALVYLLNTMNAIRCRDMNEASEALQQFFDWSAIRINDSNNLSTSILTTDQRPLRYAPLLQARLARIFGFKNQARNFLAEAIHQAQTSHDLVCLRLAQVEQAAIDAIENLRAPVGSSSTKESTGYDLSTAFLLSCSITDGTPEVPETTEKDDDDAKAEIADTQAFVQQLKDCATLQNCICLAKSGDDQEGVVRGLQNCAAADYGVDRELQSRFVREAARAISATVKFANGFFDAATNDCNRLLYFNCGDGRWFKRFDTEAHVNFWLLKHPSFVKLTFQLWRPHSCHHDTFSLFYCSRKIAETFLTIIIISQIF